MQICNKFKINSYNEKILKQIKYKFHYKINKIWIIKQTVFDKYFKSDVIQTKTHTEKRRTNNIYLYNKSSDTKYTQILNSAIVSKM